MSNQKPLKRQQLSAVSALSGPERFLHFVKRIADTESVWGLRDKEGWLGVCDDDGNQCIQFWPHADYAVACAKGEWIVYEAKALGIREFIDTWLPNFDQQGLAVAVFPTLYLSGVFVPALQLKATIENELKLYE
jgi:Protein of unknown function (DUF2750)